MIRATLAALALLALAGAATDAPAPDASLTYLFDEVKSKVLKAPGGDEAKEARVAKGDSALSGDLVKTGFWGRAVLSVPERASRFEVEPGTKVRLANGDPGVLLVVEKGRLKAFFEQLAGEPVERRVSAPGALLAVRGTRYGLEVGGDGGTLLAVFEGTVEVIPTQPGGARLLVNADELCTFGPRAAPRREPMRMRGMSEGSWGLRHGGPEGGMGGPGQGGPGHGGMGNPPGGGMGQPGGGTGSGGMGSGGGMGGGGRTGGH